MAYRFLLMTLVHVDVAADRKLVVNIGSALTLVAPGEPLLRQRRTTLESFSVGT